MKATLCITQRCNLRCDYCYIGKNDSTMDAAMASAIIDWIFAKSRDDGTIDIGLFGGEPLLAFDVVRDIVRLIEAHPRFDPARVLLGIVSNGTIFTPEIAGFVRDHHIHFSLSFDGPPDIQNRFRHFADGRGSAAIVERNAVAALAALDVVPVNAVYRPETVRRLPETLQYLSGLGFRQIYLSPDFSAAWTPVDVDALAGVFESIATFYIDAYLRDAPLFISPIDGKIAALLRGGYRADERCRMGTAEFAFTPDGRIYPCERLIGCGTDTHRIGDLAAGAAPPRIDERQPECGACALREYCMHWCACSNFFATGNYGRPGPVICASERASIAAAARAFETVEARLGPTFLSHLTGHPTLIANGRF